MTKTEAEKLYDFTFSEPDEDGNVTATITQYKGNEVNVKVPGYILDDTQDGRRWIRVTTVGSGVFTSEIIPMYFSQFGGLDYKSEEISVNDLKSYYIDNFEDLFGSPSENPLLGLLFDDLSAYVCESGNESKNIDDKKKFRTIFSR